MFLPWRVHTSLSLEGALQRTQCYWWNFLVGIAWVLKALLHCRSSRNFDRIEIRGFNYRGLRPANGLPVRFINDASNNTEGGEVVWRCLKGYAHYRGQNTFESIYESQLRWRVTLHYMRSFPFGMETPTPPPGPPLALAVPPRPNRPAPAPARRSSLWVAVGPKYEETHKGFRLCFLNKVDSGGKDNSRPCKRVIAHCCPWMIPNKAGGWHWRGEPLKFPW